MPATPTSSAGTPVPRSSRRDAHERVTDAILAQLETADPASWTPPWYGADPLLKNALTDRRYSGINVLALWSAAQANGYADACWATYRQWAALGAQVRRGEQATAILFYKDLPPTDAACTGSGDGDSDEHHRFVARTSSVFNIAQVDGAPDLAAPRPAPLSLEPFVHFDAFVAATGAVIIESGTRACYVPATDSIHLPPRAAFHSTAGYRATLTHELVHWTGHPTRLDRQLSMRFGTRDYAAEELIAELGAAFVLADLGLARHPHPDHARYVRSWLPLLRDDLRALVAAAGHASRAAG